MDPITLLLIGAGIYMLAQKNTAASAGGAKAVTPAQAAVTAAQAAAAAGASQAQINAIIAAGSQGVTMIATILKTVMSAPAGKSGTPVTVPGASAGTPDIVCNDGICMDTSGNMVADPNAGSGGVGSSDVVCSDGICMDMSGNLVSDTSVNTDTGIDPGSTGMPDVNFNDPSNYTTNVSDPMNQPWDDTAGDA